MAQPRAAPVTALNACLAFAVVAELGLGGAIILGQRPLGGVMLLALLATGAGSILLIIKSRFKSGVKAILILAVCAMLLLIFASQDVFGLRNVGNEIDEGLEKDSGMAAAPALRPASGSSTSRQPVRIELVATGGDPAFASDLASRIAAVPFDQALIGIKVSGQVRIVFLNGEPSYQLSWSIAVGAEKRWCGVVSAVGQPRDEALTSLAEKIETAINASGAGKPSCY